MRFPYKDESSRGQELVVSEMAEERKGAPHPPGGGKTIRVVEARRVQADILSLSPVELRSVLGPLAEEGAGPPSQAILSLEFLAARLRLLRERGPGGGEEGELAEVALRRLLYSEEAVPIVLWPPGGRCQRRRGCVRT